MSRFIAASKDSNVPADTTRPFGQAAEVSSAACPSDAAPLVLLLEHDAEARLMLKTMLELWDYRVADGGGETEEAESIALAERIRPDAILLDITLQYMDGFRTLRRLRRAPALCATPIIFFSGHAQPAFRNVLLALGGSDLFVKPVDFDGLRASLCSHTRKTGVRGEFRQ